jgi:predicted double-glycine peptidase
LAEPVRGLLAASGLSFVLTITLIWALPGAAGDYSIVGNGQRIQTRVKSVLEIREQNLVRQGWDISCGAAALSTVLTYDFREPYSEATIALSILSNVDPEKVRARGGFSLLDLKRFAEAVGYSARGYGGLTLEDVADSSVPVILPVRVRDFDHFVVYRGRYAGRVLIGDPAFGNLTLSEARFAKIWSSGIGFFVEPSEGEIWGGEPLAPETMNLTVPDLNYVERLIRGGGITPTTRQPRPTGM